MQEGQILCTLYFKYSTYTGYFSLGLDRIPRIGETIDFNFIIPKIMGGRFHVESVNYFIGDKEQTISIDLNSNEENLYLRLLTEKAHLRGHLSIMELFQLKYDSDYTIRERLIKMYSNL